MTAGFAGVAAKALRTRTRTIVFGSRVPRLVFA
jgi:hypothetical protein